MITRIHDDINRLVEQITRRDFNVHGSYPIGSSGRQAVVRARRSASPIVVQQADKILIQQAQLLFGGTGLASRFFELAESRELMIGDGLLRKAL